MARESEKSRSDKTSPDRIARDIFDDLKRLEPMQKDKGTPGILKQALMQSNSDS